MNILPTIPGLLKDLVYPVRCPICDEAAPFGRSICPECRPKLRRIREPFCMKCGCPLLTDEEYCSSCKTNKHFFISGRSLYYYRSVAASLSRFKNSERQEYAEFYADQIVTWLGDYIRSIGNAVLVPVPMHKDKLKKRGYNQAELLARHIGKRMGLPVDKDLVIRSDNTVSAKMLSLQERAVNLKNAFKIGRNSVKWKTAIIIDDIMTTGATVDGVARTLAEAGVERIFFVCVSSGGA